MLGPLLFSIFCNDLPNIVTGEDKLYMYADDTTIFTTGPTSDIAVTKMNAILQQMLYWCTENRMTPHPDKCEFMILNRSGFIGPMPAVRFGSSLIRQVRHTRCLGLELDDKLSWLPHVTELTKSFVQKVNLLKSLRFLPKDVRLDFYFKVILPAVTYGLVIWGSCNKTLMESIQKVHFRAARIIHGLPWDTPRTRVMSQLHWKPLTYFCKIRLGMFVHKCIFGDVHRDLQQLFTKRDVPYDLRGCNIVELPRHNSNYAKNSIRIQGAKLWNNLSDEARSTISTISFKRGLKMSL